MTNEPDKGFIADHPIFALFIGIALLALTASLWFGPEPGGSTAKPTSGLEDLPPPVKVQQDAQKEFIELRDLMIKAEVIKDFNHLESERVIYVTRSWYKMEVTTKKNILRKISSLKKTLTGSQWFEVRDAFSNEKVAEVTSFSGSVEIYK